jgi:hypothetical protein
VESTAIWEIRVKELRVRAEVNVDVRLVNDLVAIYDNYPNDRAAYETLVAIVASSQEGIPTRHRVLLALWERPKDPRLDRQYVLALYELFLNFERYDASMRTMHDEALNGLLGAGKLTKQAAPELRVLFSDPRFAPSSEQNLIDLLKVVGLCGVEATPALNTIESLLENESMSFGIRKEALAALLSIVRDTDVYLAQIAAQTQPSK